MAWFRGTGVLGETFAYALVCVLDYFLGNRDSIVCDSDVDAVAAETKVAPPS